MKRPISEIGGKSAGLFELKRMYAHVPAWETVTASVFRRVCGKGAGRAALLRDQEPALQKAAGLFTYIKAMQIPEHQLRLLERIYRRISVNGSLPVAVRSSASDEDSAILSFAGQMDSFLNVRTFEKFLDAVRGCWASLFGERAVQYRLNHGIDPFKASIAVVVQQMIEAEASGVMFTANPLNSDRSQMLVTCTWGLGEGLVSGALNADTFVLDAQGTLVNSEVAEKKQKVIFARDAGTAFVEVEKEKQEAACLSEDELRTLWSIGIKAQRMQGVPLDIEFCVADSRIYLLQARPITTLKTLKVWDNSNIAESYSGVTTPLTFSFISNAYFCVYWQFCQTIGIDEATIQKNRAVLSNMLGLIQGRVYYNLLNWYRLVSLMPGFSYNRKFMEQMMGLHVVKDFDLASEPRGFFQRNFLQLARLLKVGCKMAFAHCLLQKDIQAFHKRFARQYAHYSGLDYNTMTAPEMRALYQELEDNILWKWKAPITNDFEAMIFYGLLKNFTLKWGLDRNGTLQNDLLCGEGGIKSTEVTARLFDLCRLIEAGPGLKSAFLAAGPREALTRMHSDPAFAAVLRRFQAYMQEYGVRGVNEMKLESLTMKDDPVFCVATMQNYLRSGVPDAHKQLQRERQIRHKAEALLKERLRSPLKRALYWWVLKNCRQAIKNRENQRFCRTQAYSLVRTIFRQIARLWREKNILEQAEDIFYLRMQEIWSYIDGKNSEVDFKKAVAQRRREFEGYLSQEPPDHIETYEETYTAGSAQITEPASVPADVLRGLGCCAGVVENKVRVVLRPDSGLELKGEIMVAKQTDPGWVVLFPSVSGLIIEKGSMLSHSAIVAREMGIPAVVGVKNALAVLRDGDRVLLNGQEGTVTILEKAK